ncbi:MAG: PLP-dependent aminotransferase family protein [Caldilineaceae bacterium]|nr:PLP-dependent aminotransferase family protein [Caldilineaceae bacterium]
MPISLPTLQIDLRPGIIELGWGHPPLELLPVAAMRRATAEALTRYGAEALTYGHAAGPGRLIEWLCEYIARQEGVAPAPDELLITGGNSHTLDQILTLCTEPGDTVLVESPTYHLAVRILREHPVHLVGIPMDQDGLIVDALSETLAHLRRQGIRPRLLYTIPTHHNPTGVSLSLERRRALVELGAETGLLIVEDDVYRELSYDGPAPPSLWRLAPPGVVVRMGSFSKSLAPGLRLGWLTGGRNLVQRMAHGGLLDSGGGINHFTALVVAELCASGDFDEQVARVRTIYGVRRDALLAALREQLPPGCSWYSPGGGFFVWLTVPESVRCVDLLPLAERVGVSFLPGEHFFLDGGGEEQLRLSFSLYPPEELVSAATILGAVVRNCSRKR